MPTVLVTFDLPEEVDSEKREDLYKALEKLGVSELSPKKKLKLPQSTVYGSTEIGTNASAVGAYLQTVAEEHVGTRFTRLAVAVVEDFAVWTAPAPDPKRDLRELIASLVRLSQG